MTVKKGVPFDGPIDLEVVPAPENSQHEQIVSGSLTRSIYVSRRD